MYDDDVAKPISRKALPSIAASLSRFLPPLKRKVPYLALPLVLSLHVERRRPRYARTADFNRKLRSNGQRARA